MQYAYSIHVQYTYSVYIIDVFLQMYFLFKLEMAFWTGELPLICMTQQVTSEVWNGFRTVVAAGKGTQVRSLLYNQTLTWSRPLDTSADCATD